jgi:chromosome segregation ATPase
MKTNNEENKSTLKKLNDENSHTNLKIQTIERNNKLLLEKVKEVTDEKNGKIQEEKEKREQLERKCEEFKKDVDEKFSKDVIDKEQIIEDNNKLRVKLEEYKVNMEAIKANLEEQIDDKNKQANDFETDFKTQIQSKMDEMLSHTQGLTSENKALRSEVMIYQKKIEESANSMGSYTTNFENLKKEFEKVT